MAWPSYAKLDAAIDAIEDRVNAFVHLVGPSATLSHFQTRVEIPERKTWA